MPEMEMAIAGSRAVVRARGGVEAIDSPAGLDRIGAAWERMASGSSPVSDFAYARAWVAGLDGAHGCTYYAQAVPSREPSRPWWQTAEPPDG